MQGDKKAEDDVESSSGKEHESVEREDAKDRMKWRKLSSETTGQPLRKRG